MNKLTAAIIDDERLARVTLREILQHRDDVRIVGEADGVAAGAKLIEDTTPDLVFLDIQMPDGSGFDIFDRVAFSSHVIFTTAYSEHAVRAFAVNALDYLVKPTRPALVARAIERAKAQERRDGESRDQTPLQEDDLVCLQESQRLKFSRVRDIVFIEAAGDYSEVHLRSGDTLLVNQSVRRWEQRLPTSFVRIYRSTLVNLAFVDEIVQSNGRWTVKLQGREQSLTMSRRYSQALRKRLSLFS